MNRPSIQQQVEAVRRFTRFFTRHVGVLNKALHGTPYSLPEARLLFELARQGEASAAELGEYLGMDAGYLSRMLAKLEKQGLIWRETDTADARRRLLRLTVAGQDTFATLNARSRYRFETMLSALAPGERERLIAALDIAEEILGAPPEPARPWLLRSLRPGDIGWITHRHGVLYHEEYGWDETFEALVAKILGEYVAKRDPQRERGWVAESGGEIVGSVFATRADDDVAQLRLLYVEPKMRGQGLGRALVAECIEFARNAGYQRMTLWTNSVLDAARHIYASNGFEVVRTESHRSFGHDLVGEYWERAL